MATAHSKNIQSLFDETIACLSLEEFEDESTLVNPIKGLPPILLVDLMKLRTRDDKKDTLLHRAARKSYAVFLKEILSILPQSVRLYLLSIKNHLDATVLIVAAIYGTESTLQSIIESLNEKEMRDLLHIANSDGFNVLHCLAQSNSYVSLKCMMKSITAEEFRNLMLSESNHKQTGLHMAACNVSDDDMVSRLIHSCDLATEDILKAMKTDVCIKFCMGLVKLQFPFLNWLYSRLLVANGFNQHPNLKPVLEYLQEVPARNFPGEFLHFDVVDLCVNERFYKTWAILIVMQFGFCSLDRCRDCDSGWERLLFWYHSALDCCIW